MDSVVGNSVAMQEVRRKITSFASSSFSVMICGETGVGKGLVAEEIHKNSSRSKFPFIGINCAAIPETLLESELFGAEKGSYTGSVGLKIGIFEAANGGTVFLDEIGDLTPFCQVKLLKALQEKKIRRIGATKDIDVDVRIIAATHRNIGQLIEEGKFREDLYYRLMILYMEIPPLRKRPEDIPDLIVSIFNKYNNEKKITITDNALNFLKLRSWGGNVRELENVVARIMAEGVEEVNEINVKNFVGNLITISKESSQTIQDYLLKCVEREKGRKSQRVFLDVMNEVEKELIGLLYDRANNNAAAFVREFGLTRPTLREKLTKYGFRNITSTIAPETSEATNS